jgi:hypothetical protein
MKLVAAAEEKESNRKNFARKVTSRHRGGKKYRNAYKSQTKHSLKKNKVNNEQ